MNDNRKLLTLRMEFIAHRHYQYVDNDKNDDN